MKLFAILLLALLIFGNHSFIVKSNALTNTSNNFATEDFPLTLVSVAVSNSSYDLMNLQMLKDSGVNTITLEVDYFEFVHYEDRYNQTIQDIHDLGLKLDIINQMDTRADMKDIGLVNPLYNTILPPRYSTVLWYEQKMVSLYASYHPDFFSVLAEPSNLNVKLHTGFSAQTWTGMIEVLTNLSKSISPETLTLADLLPVTNICDYSMGSLLVADPNLDAIGWDVYNSTRFQTAVSPAIYELSNGKQVALTETYWEDIHTETQYDSPQYAQNASDWFSSNYAKFNLTGFVPLIYSPFFSNDFVILDPLPTTVSGAMIYYSNYDQALINLNRTEIFYAYQQTIATES